MVASFLLWGSNMDYTAVGGGGEQREPSKGFEAEQQEMMMMKVNESTTRTTVKPRGRKGSKSAQKKQPQRGLGVAQLERLRAEESKTHQNLQGGVVTSDHHQIINTTHQNLHGGLATSDHHQIVNTHQNLHHPFQFQHHQFPFIEQHLQQTNISVPFSRFGTPINYGGATAINGVHHQPTTFLFHHQPTTYKLGNGGGFPPVATNFRPVFPNQFEENQLNIAREVSFQNRNLPVESPPAKELSSNPNVHCLYERCDICRKKNRINGENLGFDGGRTTVRNTESIKPINGQDFLELDLGRNWNVDDKDFGSRGVIRAGYPGVYEQEVEVMGGHQRKGKSVRGNNNILMEYEFFPGGGSSSNSTTRSMNKESLMVESAKTGGAAVGEPSHTNFLDLSLKLSC